jgi:hypothetical protein
MSTLLRSELQRSAGPTWNPYKATAEHTAPRHSPLGSEASCGSYGLSKRTCIIVRDLARRLSRARRSQPPQDFHTGITRALWPESRVSVQLLNVGGIFIVP